VVGWLLLWLGCAPAPPAERLEQAREQVSSGEVSQGAAALWALCEEGLVEACAARAAVDEGPAEEVARAAERACEASVAAACVVRSSTPGDRWDQAACASGDGRACERAADASSDPAERQRFDAQACHLQRSARCLPAAVHAWRAQQGTRAIALAERACADSEGPPGGCGFVSGWRDALEAERRCGTGDEQGCRQACAAGIEGMCDRALPTLRRACGDGDGAACRLGALLGGDGVEEALWRACDEVARVDPWACLLLADRVEAGAPLPSAARGDVPWLRNQACDLQLDYGCASHEGW
jgi:hypothetical protein